MGYKYSSILECADSGEHLNDCDNDGYCNHCGEQDPIEDWVFRTNADELVKLLRNAWLNLLREKYEPDNSIVYDKCDPKITVGNTVDIFPCEVHVKTIARDLIMPGYAIVVYKCRPASRWHPEELEDITVGETRYMMEAAKMAVETYFNVIANGFWDSVADAEFAKDVLDI